jgi:hypothetical protein
VATCQIKSINGLCPIPIKTGLESLYSLQCWPVSVPSQDPV